MILVRTEEKTSIYFHTIVKKNTSGILPSFKKKRHYFYNLPVFTDKILKQIECCFRSVSWYFVTCAMNSCKHERAICGITKIESRYEPCHFPCCVPYFPVQLVLGKSTEIPNPILRTIC